MNRSYFPKVPIAIKEMKKDGLSLVNVEFFRMHIAHTDYGQLIPHGLTSQVIESIQEFVTNPLDLMS